MNSYNSLKNDLSQINKKILSLISDAKSIPGMTDQAFEGWETICENIETLMEEEIIRVAVVGPIKSGKSTAVNSILQGDFLKRGAGVVTSIVTRVRSGQQLQAELYFKSWDDINSEIERALVLFPSFSKNSENESFDIRRSSDRQELEQALFSLNPELLITDDTRNVNSVLLSSYLKGFDRVSDIISAENTIKQYTGSRFHEHMGFTGNEILAVYLKDIQLEIDTRGIGSNVEIADCQGSDSPNPLHLVMIQDYLLLTNLIVYVISSRTGIRQADIRFLSMIKKMGIMDNILFVVNCDFNEHESVDNLKSLIKKVREDLSLIKPDPEVYSFSGLYNLFQVQNKDLPPKDMARFEQWKDDTEFSKFSDQETAAFNTSFSNKLSKERYSLLLKNNIEKLKIISSGLQFLIDINNDVLKKDTDSVNEIINKIKAHQEKMNQIKTLVRSTLDGGIQRIKNELKRDVDRFFAVGRSGILPEILNFIKNYMVNFEKYEKNYSVSGFSSSLYIVFQDFRQALDTFIAETINPEIIGFVKQAEIKIQVHLESISDTYHVMITDAFDEYKLTMLHLGIELDQDSQHDTGGVDFDSIKRLTGLHIPPIVIALRYTTKIKTEAIMRFGFYSAINFFKKLLKKQDEVNEGILALKDGVLRMKRETEKSIIFHFKNYRENIKFQYIFKLTEGVSNNLYEVVVNRFQAYVTDLSSITELVREKRIDKEMTVAELIKMETAAREINIQIAEFRERIEIF